MPLRCDRPACAVAGESPQRVRDAALVAPARSYARIVVRTGVLAARLVPIADTPAAWPDGADGYAFRLAGIVTGRRWGRRPRDVAVAFSVAYPHRSGGVAALPSAGRRC